MVNLNHTPDSTFWRQEYVIKLQRTIEREREIFFLFKMVTRWWLIYYAQSMNRVYRLEPQIYLQMKLWPQLKAYKICSFLQQWNARINKNCWCQKHIALQINRMSLHDHISWTNKWSLTRCSRYFWRLTLSSIQELGLERKKLIKI